MRTECIPNGRKATLVMLTVLIDWLMKTPLETLARADLTKISPVTSTQYLHGTPYRQRALSPRLSSHMALDKVAVLLCVLILRLCPALRRSWGCYAVLSVYSTAWLETGPDKTPCLDLVCIEAAPAAYLECCWRLGPFSCHISEAGKRGNSPLS